MYVHIGSHRPFQFAAWLLCATALWRISCSGSATYWVSVGVGVFKPRLEGGTPGLAVLHSACTAARFGVTKLTHFLHSRFTCSPGGLIRHTSYIVWRFYHLSSVVVLHHALLTSFVAYTGEGGSCGIWGLIVNYMLQSTP